MLRLLPEVIWIRATSASNVVGMILLYSVVLQAAIGWRVFYSSLLALRHGFLPSLRGEHGIVQGLESPLEVEAMRIWKGIIRSIEIDHLTITGRSPNRGKAGAWRRNSRWRSRAIARKGFQCLEKAAGRLPLLLGRK